MAKRCMRLEASVKVEFSLEATIDGIFANARRKSLTHAHILEARQHEIFEHRAWPRLSGRAQTRINVYFHAHSRALHAHDLLRWQLYLDGARVTSAEISAAADKAPDGDRNAVWRRVVGCHEWSHSGLPFNPPTPVSASA